MGFCDRTGGAGHGEEDLGRQVPLLTQQLLARVLGWASRHGEDSQVLLGSNISGIAPALTQRGCLGQEHECEAFPTIKWAQENSILQATRRLLILFHSGVDYSSQVPLLPIKR